MSAQLDLFEGIKDTQFPAFHEKNPHVYELFKVYTNKCIARGFKHISSDFIFHIMRWESNIDIKDDMNFKINNNYTPLYSRMFLNEYPHLAGFFRTRKSKYDNIVAPKNEPILGNGLDKYFDDLEKWENSFYCNECGVDKIEDFNYDRTVANGEVWHCKHCKKSHLVDDKPNEDNY